MIRDKARGETRSGMVVETLLRAFAETDGDGWELAEVVAGKRWLLSVLRNAAGERLGGLANAHDSLDRQSRLAELADAPRPALEAASLTRSDDPLRSAVGLATMNALFGQVHGSGRAPKDGVDWLLDQAKGRRVAIVGRFPFIEEELRPVAGELRVFELEPRGDELGPESMAEVLPRCEVVTITASSLLNHTLDGMLPHLPRAGRVLLLGPSTPLCPDLFELGIHLLSGVVVTDLEQTVADVKAGVSFRRMRGTTRVTLDADPIRCSAGRRKEFPDSGEIRAGLGENTPREPF